MPPEFENELIRSVKDGNADAFESLVTENERAVFTLCLRMTGNREDAEDLTQEAFLKAYRSIGTFRGDCRFSSWMTRIASNVCLDFLRSKSKKQTVSLSVETDDGDDTELDLPDTAALPEDRLLTEQLKASLSRGLDNLSTEQRQTLILRELGGLSYDEIAKQLNIGSGTVKSRIFRARKRLCVFLLNDGNIPDDFSSSVKGGGKK